MRIKPEILAPAGQPDAAYAAFHYGADAVYLGLPNFSARAEAVNFSPEDLAALVQHAHSLAPRRNVYLTLNTLVQNDELPAAAETLAVACDAGIDAVIVQDLGVARLVREKFSTLTLHASTQMALHNLAGVRAAEELGFSRVTLARELTLDEVRGICQNTDLEIETFIHGTLCYSYSGLCLFSSMVTGRSGNRGRCVYSCREADENGKHPFSLKDMALGPRVLDLAEAGVDSLKIEGRKKSPLYVAATVDYYRRILDGKPADPERLKTIFARPWTDLFIDGRHNPDAADTDIVGHRGAPLGRIEKIVRSPQGDAVSFVPQLPVERHDGIQIDLPGDSRPYGFAVDNLYTVDPDGRLRSAFAAPAATRIAVALPPDAPGLAPGMAVYLSSSQEVKRSYPYQKPKAAAFGRALSFDLSVSVLPKDGGACEIAVRAEAATPDFLGGEAIDASLTAEAEAFPARDAEGPGAAARKAFERTGGSRFLLGNMEFVNAAGLFVKPGEWNRLRRDLLLALEDGYQRRLRNFVSETVAALPLQPFAETGEKGFVWSVCVDGFEDLTAFSAEDFDAAREVVVGIDARDFEQTKAGLDAVASRCGKEKIRLGIPLILREPEAANMARLVSECVKDGWRRWFVSNLGAFSLLGASDSLDIGADWPLYALNSLAGAQLSGLGCGSVTISPEDDADNMRKMAAFFPNRIHIVVYSDIPLFISAACAHAHLGLCGGPPTTGSCPSAKRTLKTRLEKSGGVEILPQHCGSVVLANRPYSLLGRLGMLNDMGLHKLRVDLRWRGRSPEASRTLWRKALAGQIGDCYEGNFVRGMI